MHANPNPHQIARNQLFFATVQNKFHFAVTGKTAAEIVKARANAKQPNMGLTSFSGEVVRKKDVTVAKNYLNANEVDTFWLPSSDVSGGRGAGVRGSEVGVSDLHAL